MFRWETPYFYGRSREVALSLVGCLVLPSIWGGCRADFRGYFRSQGERMWHIYLLNYKPTYLGVGILKIYPPWSFLRVCYWKWPLFVVNYLLRMVTFHGYIRLPEDNWHILMGNDGSGCLKIRCVLFQSLWSCWENTWWSTSMPAGKLPSRQSLMVPKLRRSDHRMTKSHRNREKQYEIIPSCND